MKKKFGLLVTIILSMLFLVACGGDPDKKEGASAGTAKDTLVIAQGADAKSLDLMHQMITHLQELEYKSMTD